MRGRVLGVASAVVLSVAALPLSGCGGGSGTPTTPDPTLQAIAVAIANEFIFHGSSEVATATGTLSNGTTQAVTGTWSSDNTNVATVDPTGRVTGLRSGRASIIFQSQGVTGSRLTRVVPRYEGDWIGSYVVRSCVETGDFIGIGLCDTFTTGAVLPTALLLDQAPRDSLRGTTFLGALETEPFAATIGDDGSAAFTAVFRGEGFTIDVAWDLTAPQPGQITGRLQQTWTAVGTTGELRVAADIVELVEGAGATGPTAPGSLASAIASIKQRAR